MRMNEGHWKVLLDCLRAGECTPFVGAGANDGILPLGAEIAEKWAGDFNYPLWRPHADESERKKQQKPDLAKVAQYLAINNYPQHPKKLIVGELESASKDRKFNFDDDEEPLNVLAKLPVPVYITTNYDDLLRTAIQHHGRPHCRKELCKWNTSSSFEPVLFTRSSNFEPTVATPVVYHLHGHHSELDSILLTEDDYLDFVVAMSRNINEFLPAQIHEALTKPLLFIGYSLADIDFRVLFRWIKGNLERAGGTLSVAVQLPYDNTVADKAAAEEYMTQYFREMRNVCVYWGKANDFVRELGRRWKDFNAQPESLSRAQTL